VTEQEAQTIDAIMHVVGIANVDLDSGIGQITVTPDTDKEMTISYTVILTAGVFIVFVV
jgi:hypothetical protein